MVQVNWNKLLYSRWFYYILIFVVLLFFIFYVFPTLLAYGLIEADLNLNLFSETWGLLFTLLFFVMLFELRDILEWKKVESKVKWRISWEIYPLFADILSLCEVETLLHGDDWDLDAWKDLQKRQLEQLRKGKIVLSVFGKQLLEDSKVAEGYASVLTTRKNNLSNFEIKYYRFFSSEVQCSLMDIQVEIERILMELLRSEYFGTKDADRLTKSIEKIITEIANLKENGIGIGF